VLPDRPAIRLVTDMVDTAPGDAAWHPLSISGYHLPRAGRRRSMSWRHAQGLLHLCSSGAPRGLARRFSRRCLSFFFNAHIDSARRSPVRACAPDRARELAKTLRRQSERTGLPRFCRGVYCLSGRSDWPSAGAGGMPFKLARQPTCWIAGQIALRWDIPQSSSLADRGGGGWRANMSVISSGVNLRFIYPRAAHKYLLASPAAAPQRDEGTFQDAAPSSSSNNRRSSPTPLRGRRPRDAGSWDPTSHAVRLLCGRCCLVLHEHKPSSHRSAPGPIETSSPTGTILSPSASFKAIRQTISSTTVR